MEPARLSTWIRTHERQAIGIYLGAVAALVLFIALDSFYLGWGERLAERRIDRWEQEVVRGEELVSAGRYDEAEEFLARLELGFPARHIKHRLGFTKERLLLALARAHEGAGRPARARDAYRRAAEFDPRAYQNHYLLGACLLRQGRAEEAEAPLRAALAIAPSHLESVRALTGLLFDQRRYREVVDAVESYSDAILFAELVLEVVEQVALQVLVDGRVHRVVALLSVPPGAPGTLVLRAGPSLGHEVPLVPAFALSPLRSELDNGVPIEVGDGQLIHPKAAGRMSRAPGQTTVLASQWRPHGMEQLQPGLFRGAGKSASLSVDVPASGLAAVELDVRLCKTVDSATWRQVETSFAALSDHDGLDALRGRLVITGESER